MNWALSYFQKSREIARLPIHEVIFESLCLSGTETSLTYDRLFFFFGDGPDSFSAGQKEEEEEKNRKNWGKSYGTFVSSRSAMYLRSARSFSRAVTLDFRLSASSYMENTSNISSRPSRPVQVCVIRIFK